MSPSIRAFARASLSVAEPSNEGPLGLIGTITPALDAAGADATRVLIVSAVRSDDGKGRRSFNLQADLDLLEQEITKAGDVRLVVIDPIPNDPDRRLFVQIKNNPLCADIVAKVESRRATNLSRKTRNGKHSPIRMTSIALPKSPVSLT
jgi:hypothetical protein